MEFERISSYGIFASRIDARLVTKSSGKPTKQYFSLKPRDNAVIVTFGCGFFSLASNTREGDVVLPLGLPIAVLPY